MEKWREGGKEEGRVEDGKMFSSSSLPSLSSNAVVDLFSLTTLILMLLLSQTRIAK